ncbi:MAG: ATP-binding SpoIIE family protein phosphatase [Candidatus Limnocylindria bacterium]
MTVLTRTLRRVVRRRDPAIANVPEADERTLVADAPAVEIAENDPILAYLQTAPGAVDLEALELDSPAKDALLAVGVKLVVPLVSQGELIGTLNLGPRLSEQEYSTDDRRLLDNLAGQAAPALRVAQLVRQQQAEARERQRMEQELQVAQLIQQNFLPRVLPQPAGWQVEAYYRPARAVGGDFYDFLELPGGKLGIVAGDVTDKGVPAAMVMAATRSLLRAAGQRLLEPSKVLERVNELLFPDIPARMFVTCLYGVLDPATGILRFANAGHNLPFVRTDAGVTELRATGMPLGLMPDMTYEETEVQLERGQQILLHSDGIAEAHAPDREMFGFPRLRGLMAADPGGPRMIERLLGEFERFTGADWEQEDDITLVSLHWTGTDPAGTAQVTLEPPRGARRVLDEFELPSQPGNERQAMERVATAVEDLGLEPRRLENLKTAVAEATMNAIEHGNQNRAELPVSVRAETDGTNLTVFITDQGGERPIPITETPDIEAKLAGLQKPRGWGLFLIQNMVDAMRVTSDERHHTIELVLHLKGEGDER